MVHENQYTCDNSKDEDRYQSNVVIQLGFAVKLISCVTRLTTRDFPYKKHVLELVSHDTQWVGEHVTFAKIRRFDILLIKQSFWWTLLKDYIIVTFLNAACRESLGLFVKIIPQNR